MKSLLESATTRLYGAFSRVSCLLSLRRWVFLQQRKLGTAPLQLENCVDKVAHLRSKSYSTQFCFCYPLFAFRLQVHS